MHTIPPRITSYNVCYTKLLRIVLPATSLLAGDVDGNNVIDQFDALTIGMSYTSSLPAAADLNNGGTIDFLDLELLAENYHMTGPSTWDNLV